MLGFFKYLCTCSWDSLVAQLVKNLPAMQETQVRFPDWENPPWGRKCRSTPIFLNGKSHRQRNLVVQKSGGLWGPKESDMTE